MHEAYTDINAQDQWGVTPLYIAVKHGKEPAVAKFLDNNANLQIADNSGSTPLHIACETGNLNIIKTLYEHGASFEAKNNIGKNCKDILLSKFASNKINSETFNKILAFIKEAGAAKGQLGQQEAPTKSEIDDDILILA